MKKILALCALLLPTLLVGCDVRKVAFSPQFNGCVDSFAVYFFNWRLDKAAHFCTPDSKKWLQFAASQVQPEDLEQMKDLPQNFTYSYEITQGYSKGIAAEVALNVENFFVLDSIGKPGRLKESATFPLQLVKQGETWKVRLDGLPRMVKNNQQETPKTDK